MSSAKVHSLLNQLKSAVDQPRIYLFEFFEDLRNQIDIACKIAMDESNKETMLEQQALLIERVKEFESACFENLAVAKDNREDRGRELRSTLGNIEGELQRASISEAELERMERLISDQLLQIGEKLFQNKSMLFVGADYKGGHTVGDYESSITYERYVNKGLESLAGLVKQSHLFGVLISFEDYFIKKEEAFEKK